MNKIGEIGRRNISANKKIEKMFFDREKYYCEARLTGCTRYPITPAHRHKRIYYRSQPEKLYDYKNVIASCIECHQKMEKSKSLTEFVFLRLRGTEV